MKYCLFLYELSTFDPLDKSPISFDDLMIYLCFSTNFSYLCFFFFLNSSSWF